MTNGTLFEPVRCGEKCGAVLMEHGPGFRGVVRVKCAHCKKRKTVMGDGRVVTVAMEDRPPDRVALPFGLPCCGG